MSYDLEKKFLFLLGDGRRKGYVYQDIRKNLQKCG